LAGKSALNRLELTPVRANERSRYKKNTINKHKVDAFFVDVFLQSYDKPPSTIILDLDATDDLYTAISWDGSFTAVTRIIAICRCIFSAENICYVPESNSAPVQAETGLYP